jgi:prolyl-tRNA synthetase
MPNFTLLLPKTENAPAKVKDAGVVELVREGGAAYNAKSAELLLLPEGERKRGALANKILDALFEKAGFQHVDCGSDTAVFSLAERYVREWRDAATAFAERRGRDIRLLGWSADASGGMNRTRDAMNAVLSALPAEGKFSFVETVVPDDDLCASLLSPSEGSPLGGINGFICPACGKIFLPDTPYGFRVTQPGESEREEPLEDVETPGANTINDLCKQLGIDVEYTLKAMLYVASDASGAPHPVACFLRGDFCVSMNKLSAWLKKERALTRLRTAEKAELYEMIGEVAGYCGPVGLPDNVTVVCDESAVGSKNTVVGANRPGYHRKGCCWGRDFETPVADIAQIDEGTPCTCGQANLARTALRLCGKITRADAPRNEQHKILACRDKEGAREYPAELSGTFSTESILLAACEPN